MKIQPRRNNLPSFLLLLALGVQTTGAALAQDTPSAKASESQLQSMQPKYDQTPSATVSQSNHSPEEPSASAQNFARAQSPASTRESDSSNKALLNGQVSKEDEGTSPDVQIRVNGNSISPDQLDKIQDLIKSARAARGGGLFSRGRAKAAFNPMSIFDDGQTTKLSAEDYRKMEYGIVGMESRVSLSGGHPTVVKLIDGGPCALAGVQVGDLLVKAGDHIFAEGDGQDAIWHVFAGKSGTTIDLTVLRGAGLLTFHLTRMNIEDIADDKLRHLYEMILSRYGAPDQENFAADANQTD